MKNIQNGTLNLNNLNEKVELFGWVCKKRNLGGLVFIDLRDRSGIIQLVIKPEDAFYEEASSVKNEYVLRVKGIVTERESKNMSIPTGEIEVIVCEFEVINTSIDLPFEIKNDSTALEDTRLKYRYLDLRREYYQNILKIRHKIALTTRNYFDENGFLEIETRILCKSTPEGARDYLVPSRVNKGKFYALPQSPQIFKQLLMVGGCERYFQIAKCFRDEDLRADRQPEFTQIDVEMSFVNEDDVMSMGEGLVSRIFKDVKGIDVELPLQRMKYVDAIEYYGSDKPDLRFDMKINDVTNVFEKNESSLFKGILENNGVINAVVAKNATDKFSRKDIDKLTDLVKTYKANGLMYLKFENEVSGSIAKLLSDDEISLLKEKLCIEENDIVFLVGGKYEIVKTSLGSLRCRLARILDLIKPGVYKMLWVTDFPSFEYSEEENRYVACHHPFTSPKDEDVDKLINDKANCYSKAYDIVINGYEAGGGSIRIHNQDVQSKMFEALGFTLEEARAKFGFFVDALKYGTPPHGGMAFGLDRLVMLICETENIRDVIAFPKTASASCLMSEAPNIVDEKQLKELHIKLDLGKGRLIMDLKDLFLNINEYLDKEVTLNGWVRSNRDQKNFGFIDFSDGTTHTHLQIVYSESMEGFEKTTKILIGSAIEATGKIVRSQGSQDYEMQAVKITVLGDCPSDYPLQAKGRPTREFLREIAYLRPRTNLFQAVFRVRSVAAYAIHKYFQENNFVYAHTPIITASDCEGAGEMFQVTTLDLERIKSSNEVDYSKDFFAKPASLTVSGQLQAETFALAYKKTYTFGPTFRAENSNAKTHASEFWMIEPEMAFCDLEGDMNIMEGMLKYVVKYVLDNLPEEMKFLDQFVEKGLIDKLNKLVNSEFTRIDHKDVIEILKKAPVKWEFKPKQGEDIAKEHEKYITEYFGGPVFIKNWPKDIKAFYMKLNEDNQTVAAVDLEVPGAGELMGGSQREENLEKLLSRMDEMGVPKEGMDWYINLRKYGGCVHSGFGMGFERLLIYLTGVDNIRDVIPYPRTPGNCEF